FWKQSGRHLLRSSFTAFDPEQTSDAFRAQVPRFRRSGSPQSQYSTTLRRLRLRPAAASELYPPANDVEGANFHCHRLDQETNRVHVASPFFPELSVAVAVTSTIRMRRSFIPHARPA